MGDLERLVEFEPMLGDQLGEIGAIDAPRHVVARRESTGRRGCRR